MKAKAWIVVMSVAAGMAFGESVARKDRESDAVEGEPMVVTARGYETAAALTPGSLGIVEGRTAILYPAVSAAAMLRSVPGVAAVHDGAWGADVTIRGLSRESVTLMIDGVRINTATDLSARFSVVDPMAIERIEVLKGPVSALYGSGSIGGVVHVITRQGHFAAKPSRRVGAMVRAGDNPAGVDGFLYVQDNDPRYHVFASQSWRDRESYTDGTGNEVDNSQFQDRETRLRGAWRAGKRLTLDANLQYYDGRDIGVPGSGSAPLPSVATVTYPRTSRSLVKLGGSLEATGDWLETLKLDLHWHRIERRVRIDGLPSASPVESLFPQADHDTRGMLLQARGGRQARTLILGADVWERTMVSSRLRNFRQGALVVEKPLPDVSYQSAGLFAEERWTVTDYATVTAGARWDHIRVENDPAPKWERGRRNESSWNAHAGGVMTVSDTARIKAVAASGYRAASLEERYQYLNLGGGRVKLGNPELKPERSLFFEAGLDTRGSALTMGWAVFANRLRDLIGEQFPGEKTIVNANVDEALIVGGEWEAAWWLRPTFWQVRAHAAYAEGRDLNTRDYLPGVPPLSGALELRYDDRHRYRGHIKALFASDQEKSPEGVADADGWVTAHAAVSRRFESERAAGDVSLMVDNIFDTAYRNYLSTYRGAMHREPGRAFSVQLRIEL